MTSSLPPLRALQAFECFGRTGSVNAAARALGVTPGAISQQLRLLEEHLGVVLLVKDGRRAALTPAARAYHELISQGFGRLALAQAWLKPAGVIMLDEPSEGLDDAQAVAVLSRMADRAAEAGRSLLVVTHNPAVISLFGTRVSLQAAEQAPG